MLSTTWKVTDKHTPSSRAALGFPFDDAQGADVGVIALSPSGLHQHVKLQTFKTAATDNEELNKTLS